MDKKKIELLVLLFMLLISINSIVYGKYVIENISTVATINIDRNPPQIDMVSISNTNWKHSDYANKTHTIKAQIRIKEKNIKENNFNSKNITAFVGENIVDSHNIKITKIDSYSENIYYTIELNNLEGNGSLKINIKRRDNN